MTAPFSTSRMIALLMVTFSLSACTSYDPVPVEDCKKVVKHAMKVLKNFDPKRSDLMKSCKGATDSQRGCVMASKKAGKLAQCM